MTTRRDPEGAGPHDPDVAARTSIRLEFVLNAPITAVFRAWTDPDLLCQWFGPTDGVRAEAEVDLRLGGRYAITMGQRTTRGTYLAIDPPRYLRFTWAWDDDDPPVETEVAVTLEPDGERTRMVLVHERLPLEVDCMGFETGWRRTLARLERFFDGFEGVPAGNVADA